MLQKYSAYRILNLFFDCPTKGFYMREISRAAKLSQPSVINRLKELTKEDLIVKDNRGLYPVFKANRDNPVFRAYKTSNMLLRITELGLLDYINDICLSDSIILFGSASTGYDTDGSDIDLFVQSPEKKLSLSKYERQLNRKISVFFEENFLKLSPELKNNILNGIVLKGYLKVF